MYDLKQNGRRVAPEDLPDIPFDRISSIETLKVMKVIYLYFKFLNSVHYFYVKTQDL